MNTSKSLFLIILGLIGVGCWKEDDNGKYYESDFTDEVFSVITTDSVHIVITQYGTIGLIKDSIPYSVVNNANMGDTIKIRMDVKFGSSSETPSPIKEITVNKDTLFLWYSSGPPPNNSLSKTKSILQATAIPKPTYYSIQSAVIIKSPNKIVTFQSRNIVR